MSYMFYNCPSLTSLDLTNFNTNNVKNFNFIFYGINKSCEISSNDTKIKNQLIGYQML